MFLSRIQLFVAMLCTHIVLPIVLLIGLFFMGGSHLTTTLIGIVAIGSVIVVLFKAGAWEFTNYYMRYGLIFLWGIMSIRNLIVMGEIGGDIAALEWVVGCIGVSVFLATIYLNSKISAASKVPQKYMKLAFPFKEGKYIITDGGDGQKSSLINYHYKAGVHKNGSTNTSMRYAVDIAKMSRMGKTVPSVLTKDNAQYHIFNEPIFSPCEGIIVKVENGIGNNIPFSRKFPYNVGNCVVIQKDQFYVVMGHMESGSITVKVGDHVKTGQQLGIIGNSGLTPRPHLHIQVSSCEDGLYWEGDGVPILFEDKFYPVKNKIIAI